MKTSAMKSKLSTDPIIEKEKAAANEIIDILYRDKSIRDRVFRDLYVKNSDHLEWLEDHSPAAQNARLLAFCPDGSDVSTAAAKQKTLETIAAEINGLQSEIEKNRSCATKLMRSAVEYAKAVGDRLLFVKFELLEHGKYEDWVEENFEGGLSTARAYTRLAKQENWQKIAPRFYRGKITLKEALALIRERPAEKEEDTRRRNWMKALHRYLDLAIRNWSDDKLSATANASFISEVAIIGDRQIRKLETRRRFSDPLKLEAARLRLREQLSAKPSVDYDDWRTELTEEDFLN
jgi:hypothetical protein